MTGTDCLIEQITSGTFAEDLHASDWHASSFPFVASLELTSACNIACKHCYLRYNGSVLPDKSTHEVETLLETLRDWGVLFLVFTGGEPLTRPDFRAIYRKAKQCGFFLTLFTNGTLLDDSLMDFLADAPPRRVELTIYGHSEQTYEAVTGAPGSYRRFRQGVDGLLKRGILVRLKSMIMHSNAHELDAMRDWALSLGCGFRYDAIIHPCLDGDSSPLNERLSPVDIAKLRRRDRERQPAPAQPPATKRRALFECGAGIMTVHVDAQHQAHPCLSWRQDPFDLTTRPPMTALKAHLTALRNRPAPGGLCDACEHRSQCACCPAFSILETGRADGAPLFFCQLTKSEQIP